MFILKSAVKLPSKIRHLHRSLIKLVVVGYGGKIPRPIRIQVKRLWLEGKPRDKIAEELEISTGAVGGEFMD